MITLNLIPPHDKRELRLVNVFLAIKNLLAMGLIGVITIAVFLIGTRMFLQNYYDHLTAANRLRQVSSRRATSDQRSRQTELAAIMALQQAYVPWSELLLALSAQVNPGITLTDVVINQTGQAELSGVALRRDDLLRFHDQLIGSGLAAGFTIPLATQFQEADIKFRLSLRLNVPHLPTP